MNCTSTTLNITVVRISTTQACILETRWRTIAYDDAYRSTFSLDIGISTSTIKTTTFVLLVIVALLVLYVSSLPCGYAGAVGVLTIRSRLRMHVCAYVVVKTRLESGIAKLPASLKLLKSMISLSHLRLGFWLLLVTCTWNLFSQLGFCACYVQFKIFQYHKGCLLPFTTKVKVFLLFHIFVVRLSVLCAEGSSILISQSMSKHSFTAVTALCISKSDPLVTACVEAPCKLTSLVSPCTSCAVVIKSNRQRQLIRGLLRKSIAKRKKTTK